MDSAFTDIVRELTEVAKSYKTHEAAIWFKKVLMTVVYVFICMF